LVGLPVTSLRFPVNPASSQVAACVRTIGLASKAPPAYAEPQTAEAAANLHQKQKNGLRPCKPSEAMVKIRCLWSFRSLAELFSKPEVTASGFPLCARQGACTRRRKSSMDPDDGNHEPNTKGYHREVGSEGRCKQNPGLRNTLRIRGGSLWTRGQRSPKSDSHPEETDVDATGTWDESACAIPGEICSPALC
jgi:hypothetical protein